MANKLHDNVSRVKKFNVLGTATFIGLRSADAAFQYVFLNDGWASKLVQILGGRSTQLAQLNSAGGGLQPYYTIIAMMALGSSLKQIITMLVVSEQDTPVSSAIVVSLFNTVLNSLNSLFSVWQFTSESPPTAASITDSPSIIAGLGFYLVSISVELLSELQRTAFKKDPAHKGKPYAGGLFSLATHINYGAYTIWRAFYAFTSGGALWGFAVGLFFFYDFAHRGVPVLDQYLSQRYGSQWTTIKARVPYKLIPGIY